jgi:hypothetical protein
MIGRTDSQDNRLRAEGVLRSCRDQAHTSSVYPKKSAKSWRTAHVNIRHRIVMSPELRSFCLLLKTSPMMSSLHAWILLVKSSANGGSASIESACRGWTNNLGAAGRPVFPPKIAVEVKPLLVSFLANGIFLCRACRCWKFVAKSIKQGVVASISGATLWRWLGQDAIQPWRFRTWLSARPQFRR